MTTDICSVRRARWTALLVSARIALIQGAAPRTMIATVLHGREVLVGEMCREQPGETVALEVDRG